MQIAIACLLVFLVMAVLMYSRLVSALLALPIMAILIAVVGGVPAPDILKDIIDAGVMKLHVPYTTTMIGAILAELVNKLGIARAMVRWVAEFAGDSPFLLGLFLVLITALLFSSLGGLGAVIMVGTIILPVMLSLGISAVTAGALYLFAISLGGMFNLANWQLYIAVLKISQSQIGSYVLPFSACICFLILIFLVVELKSWKNISELSMASTLVFIAFVSMFGVQRVATESGTIISNYLYSGSITAMALLLLLALVYACWRQVNNINSLPGLAFLAPVLPLLLVLAFRWDIISAFGAGIVYSVLITWQKSSINMLTRAIVEGSAVVMPAVMLMMGIGMLLSSVMHPAIAQAVGPLLAQIVPTHALPYVIVFTAIAPLALYRGPLSLWGMGSGLVALVQKSTALSASAIMSMLMSVGQLQGICDPTNTHNVWIATYLGTDTQTLLRKTIPYAWAAVLLGLCLAVFLHYVP